MWKLDPKYSQLTNPLEPLINFFFFGGGDSDVAMLSKGWLYL